MLGNLLVPEWIRRAIAYVVGLLVLVGIAAFFWTSVKREIQAPIQTQLDVSRANNAGLERSAAAQNAGVDALVEGAKKRKASSAAAVNAAGGVQFKRVPEIESAPAVGSTDYERAVNRIDRELGLR